MASGRLGSVLARFVLPLIVLGFACHGSTQESTFALRAGRVDRLVKEPGHVYVCTFNVYKLGSIEAKYDALEESDDDDDVPAQVPERITALANVLAVGAFDIVVLQEVTDGERGTWALTDLVHELKNKHNLTYEFFLSGYIGKGLMPEAMAFIYNPATVTSLVLPGTTGVVANIEIPGRDLVRTKWVAGNFDFTLISAHLAWGNEADRKAGDRKVHEILTTPTPSEFSDDPDILVLGDFNRFGSNFGFFDGLGYDTTKYFAPNIGIFDPTFKGVKQVTKASIAGKGIPNDNPQLLSTTVAKNTFTYDMVLLTKDVDEEFPGDTTNALYGKDFGVIHYDEKDGFGYQDGADKLSQDRLKELYSDHRPLWMRFSTTGNTKDTPGSVPTTYVATIGGKRFHYSTCATIAGSTIAKTWTKRDEALATHGPCGVCKP